MPLGVYEKTAEIYSNIYTKINTVASKAYENGLSLAGLSLMLMEFFYGGRSESDVVSFMITNLIDSCITLKEGTESEYIYDETQLEVLYRLVDGVCSKLMEMVDKKISIDSMALYCLLMVVLELGFSDMSTEMMSMLVLPISIMDKIIEDRDKLVDVDYNTILMTLYNQFNAYVSAVAGDSEEGIPGIGFIDFESYVEEFIETYKTTPAEYYETNGGAATFDAISELSWHNYLFCSVIDTLSGKEGSTFKMSSEKQRCNRDLVLTMLTQIGF